MSKDIFKILLLIARPAAGKSEILHHLRHTPPEERLRRYHIGEMIEIDDFPMLWTWFEEDDILTEMGYPRLHSDEDYNFLGNHLWNVLIRRISLEYHKLRRDHPHLHQAHTVLIEFARGKEHGGFREAFRHLSDEIVERMGVMYINVSWEESLRKNRTRFNPQRPDSILEHGLTDEKMEKLYRHVDWEEISADDPQFLTIQGRRVPYVVFENEDDVTTRGGEALAARLEETLGRLWRIYS